MAAFHDLDAVDRRYQVRVAKLGNVTIKVPSPFVPVVFHRVTVRRLRRTDSHGRAAVMGALDSRADAGEPWARQATRLALSGGSVVVSLGSPSGGLS